MVRAGVVHHPSEWPFCGYNEIQEPKRKKVLRNHKKLTSLLGFDSYGEVIRYQKGGWMILSKTGIISGMVNGPQVLLLETGVLSRG